MRSVTPIQQQGGFAPLTPPRTPRRKVARVKTSLKVLLHQHEPHRQTTKVSARPRESKGSHKLNRKRNKHAGLPKPRAAIYNTATAHSPDSNEALTTIEQPDKHANATAEATQIPPPLSLADCYNDDLTTSVPSESFVSTSTPALITATIAFLVAMKHEQHTLCEQSDSYERQVAKLRSTKFKIDYPRIRYIEEKIAITAGLCSDLFVAESAFRLDLEEHGGDVDFDLEVMLGELQVRVEELVEKFDENMSGFKD